jgi:hypothetical protein
LGSWDSTTSIDPEWQGLVCVVSRRVIPRWPDRENVIPRFITNLIASESHAGASAA